jgi:hypothetical protein
MIGKYEFLMKLNRPCKISHFHTGLRAVNFLKVVPPAPQCFLIQTLKLVLSGAVFTKGIKETRNWGVESVCLDALFTEFVIGIGFKICLFSR